MVDSNIEINQTNAKNNNTSLLKRRYDCVHYFGHANITDNEPVQVFVFSLIMHTPLYIASKCV